MERSLLKAASDIVGFEYDWLAVDVNGYVALFSTAGAGFAPANFLKNVELHKLAIDSIMELPMSTQSKFSPDLPSHCVNTWRLVAERGLYAYDNDPNGGPYYLVAAPIKPLHISDFVPTVCEAALGVVLTISFDNNNVVTDEMLLSAG